MNRAQARQDNLVKYVVAFVLIVLAYMIMYGPSKVFSQQTTNVRIVGPTGNMATVTAGKLDVGATVSATVDTTGLSTSINQTSGAQKSQACDSGGTCATVTGNRLDVNATPASPADTVGTPVNLSAGTGTTASVALAGQQGAEFCLAAGTLAATVTPEVSQDGGTTYVAGSIFDINSVLASAVTVTNPNALTCYSYAYFGSITHARIRVTAYTSGNAVATVRATGNRSQVQIMGTQSLSSGGLRPLVTDVNGVLRVNIEGATTSGNRLQTSGFAQVYNGTTFNPADFGAGNSTADTIRTVIATDQAAISIKGTGIGSPVIVGFNTTNIATNIAQFGATNVITAGTGGLSTSAPSQATAGTPARSEGTYNALSTDLSGQLRVNCTSGCTGSSFADASAFTFGTTTISNSGYVVDDVATNTVAENSSGTGRMNTNRIPYTMSTGPTGTQVGTMGNPTVVSFTTSSPSVTLSGTSSINVAQVNGTTAVTNGNGILAVAGSTSSGLIVQGSGTGNAVIVGFQTSTIAVNTTQFGGTNISTGTGSGGAGIPRVTVSSDSSLAANQSVNVNQIAGLGAAVAPYNSGNAIVVGWQTSTPSFNLTQVGTVAVATANTTGMLVNAPSQASANTPVRTEGSYNALSTDLSGNLKVNIITGAATGSSYGSAFPATGTAVGFRDPLKNMAAASVDYYGNLSVNVVSMPTSASPASRYPTRLAGTFNQPISSSGSALDVNIKYPPAAADPCQGMKGNAAISQTATTRTVLGKPGLRIFVCYERIVAGVAEIVSWLEGTGSACATAQLAVSGSTTLANGESYAANGGQSAGDGIGSVNITAIPGNDLCLGQSGANRVAGSITFAYGP